jgi:hypothetical protein
MDLGFAPPSNAYLSEEQLLQPEQYFPLKVRACTSCWLVQTEDYAAAQDLFRSDYAYFSSTSSTWLEHARAYAQRMTKELQLDSGSFVIEVASNDGYLLQNFVNAKIPCLGIEPASDTAAASKKLGIPVIEEFFGEALGRRISDNGKKADLIIGNNVYAHVPNINDFTKGLKMMLKPRGTITLEFPHLMELLKFTQFDTLYHEHFSYLSLFTVSRIFASCGLRIWHAEKINTHGGSLRVFGCHEDDPRTNTEQRDALVEEEELGGLQSLGPYLEFQQRANQIKDDLLSFLLDKKRLGARVVGYGAAAKGNTILNFAGVKADLLPVIYDAAPSKQNKFLPGSHIPIRSPRQLAEDDAQFVLILPWNLAEEVTNQLREAGRLQTQYVTAIPRLSIKWL